MQKLFGLAVQAARAVGRSKNLSGTGQLSIVSVFSKRCCSTIAGPDWTALAGQKEKALGFEEGSLAKAIEVGVQVLRVANNGCRYSSLPNEETWALQSEMIRPLILAGMNGNLANMGLTYAEELIASQSQEAVVIASERAVI